MKFFVISDIHSYYTPMITALNESGFDKTNPEHTLVVCGDSFDRGTQSIEVLEFLNSVERKVLIKGNHDDLLMELLNGRMPKPTDTHNGTTETIFQLGYNAGTTKFSDYCIEAYQKYTPLYNQMVNYFETENYIFVHSWIPTKEQPYNVNNPDLTEMVFDENWRSADEERWKAARWVNPYIFALAGLKPDKTIVFGHWHTSWPRARLYGGYEYTDKADFSIFYGDGYIGIDAMTSYSGKVNVLVIEDTPIGNSPIEIS